VIGILLEKLEGTFASIEDLPGCEEALDRLHSLGLSHGDVNRYNFIIGDGWVKMIDFETCQETQDSAQMEAEISRLAAELQDDSGRGAGFMTDDEDNE